MTRRLRKWLGRLSDWLMESAGPEAAAAGAQKLLERGRLVDAERGFAQAAHQFSRQLGPNHPYTVSAMARHAWTLTALGHHRAASQIYEQAVRAKRDSGDDEEPRLEDLQRYWADAMTRIEPRRLDDEGV